MAKIINLFNQSDLSLLEKSWAPSPCPFLSAREMKFLWVLYSRTDNHMNSPFADTGLSPEGEKLKKAGYTPELHKLFKQSLNQPESLTKDFLHPVLELLQDFYSGILTREFECKRKIFSTYESWFNTAAINPSVAKEIDRELRNLSADNNYCDHRIQTLVSINNNIRALLHRPTQAEINFHPAYERSRA